MLKFWARFFTILTLTIIIGCLLFTFVAMFITDPMVGLFTTIAVFISATSGILNAIVDNEEEENEEIGEDKED